MKRIFYSTIITLSFLTSITLLAQVNDVNLTESSSIVTLKSVNQEVQLSIYPQPSNGEINLSYSEIQNQNPKVLVYDLLGNLVNNIETERLNSTTFALDLSQKKPGYYFIKIQSESGTVSRRITIKP